MKIAIVGTAQSSVLDALKLGDDWHIWSLNGSWNVYKDRSKLHFEIHSEEQLVQDGVTQDYLDYLSSIGEKLIVLHKNPRWPSATPYPTNEVVKHFNKHKYFNNTVAYMLAFAIMQNPKEIAIYGVDMATDDFRGGGEYTYQRPCCEYYIGWAEGMGIKVTLPSACPLRKTAHMYAAEMPMQQALFLKGKYKEAMEQQARIEHDRQQHMNAANQRMVDSAYYKGVMDFISNASKQLHYDMPVINRAIDAHEKAANQEQPLDSK